jgi:hypothetical protein
VRATLETHLGSHKVARIVYGSIIGLAFVVALQDHPPRPAVLAIGLLLTGLAVALAEIYSEVVGVETAERHRVTGAQFAEMAGNGGAVAFGAAFPAVFFLLAAIDVLELATAFTIAKVSGLGLIGFYAYWAARFAGSPVPRAFGQAAIMASVGAVVIALKALLH